MLFCSGKVYYDLKAAREESKDGATAIVRVEQLYPFPADGLAAALASYPSAEKAVWVQEEARNMGAWSFVQPRLRRFSAAASRSRYAGRAPSASPATGNAAVHKAELKCPSRRSVFGLARASRPGIGPASSVAGRLG